MIDIIYHYNDIIIKTITHSVLEIKKIFFRITTLSLNAVNSVVLIVLE